MENTSRSSSETSSMAHCGSVVAQPTQDWPSAEGTTLRACFTRSFSWLRASCRGLNFQQATWSVRTSSYWFWKVTRGMNFWVAFPRHSFWGWPTSTSWSLFLRLIMKDWEVFCLAWWRSMGTRWTTSTIGNTLPEAHIIIHSLLHTYSHNPNIHIQPISSNLFLIRFHHTLPYYLSGT